VSPLTSRGSLAAIGENLTDTAIQRGRRPKTLPPVAITDRDLRVLGWLEHHRFASTQMLATLFWGRLGSAARDRLKLLHDAGFLDKLRPYGAGGGSSEWIYSLTPRGWQALSDRDQARATRLRFGEVNDLAYVSHDLQLDALLLELFVREHPGTGPLIERLRFQWHGPELGRVERDGGPMPRRPSPAALLPEGHGISRANSLPGILEPDATLLGASPKSGRPVTVMIEYDRTQRPSKQRDRWRRYDRFLTETWREGRFADHHAAPLVLYLLPRTKLLPAFLKEADKHLTAWTGPANGHPSLGRYPGRDHLLFTSRERLLAADWTMECVPAQPADVRGTQTVHPRVVNMPLPRVFASSLPVQAAA